MVVAFVSADGDCADVEGKASLLLVDGLNEVDIIRNRQIVSLSSS